jgi:molecular chaperone DnaK
VINILEGKVGTLPGANINIGYIEIKGTDLPDDLIKGTDIELHFKISESRDLTVEVYIPGADHEIIETFNPQYQGSFDHKKIIDEINRGKTILEDEIARLQDSEDFERLGQLKKLNEELDDLKGSVQLAMDEILTVNKFQLLEKKRRLLNETDRLILLQDISFEIEDYQWTKTAIERELKDASPSLKREFDNIVRDEKVFLQSGDKYLIRRKKKALEKIGEEAFINSDHYYYQFFLWLTTLEPHEFTDYNKVKRLLQDGNAAMQASDVNKLRGICNVAYSYVKDKNRRDRSDGFSSTGLK